MSLESRVLTALRRASYDSQLRSERRKLIPLPEHDRILSAKLPGVCDKCNEDFGLNTRIVWNTLTKNTYHYNCSPNNPINKKDQEQMHNSVSPNEVKKMINTLRNKPKQIELAVTDLNVGDSISHKTDGRTARIVRVSKSTGYLVARVHGRGYDVAMSPLESKNWSVAVLEPLPEKKAEKLNKFVPIEGNTLVSIKKKTKEAQVHQIGKLPAGSTFRSAQQASEKNIYMVITNHIVPGEVYTSYETDSLILTVNLGNGKIYKAAPTKTVVLVSTDITYSDK